MTSGIYAIVNTINGKVYIGSSKSVEGRCNGHFRDLRNHKHYNVKLQRAWNKYGEQSFSYCK